MLNIPPIEKDIIRQFQKPGPRYTSYPAAVHFHDGFNDNHYAEIARQTNEDLVPSPLSLYFHIPFCRHICFYCACNRIITNNHKRAETYLGYLHREIALQGELFDRDRIVEQLHWGGGTPTFISNNQMRELINVTRDSFSLRDDDKGDYSIEIDPREVNQDTIPVLREIGFNRVSVGVQDFNRDVQNHVNRVQTVEQTEAVITSARKEGFRSVNIDLIYGLPGQTTGSFLDTMKTVIEINPDRIAVYNYAHLPHLFKSQKRIDESLLPDADVKIDILQQAVAYLKEQGYVYIGMDHFARPEDELAQAQRNGTLHRNFQGYSTRAGCDIVGMGLTAISSIDSCYAQNTGSMPDYEREIKNNRIPVKRGIKLDADDLLRRDVINRLICNFCISFPEIEESHYIDFEDYFHDELISLGEMETLNLIVINRDNIKVTPKGRFLIRNICMVFDKYLHPNRFKGTFSRVI